MKKDNVNFKSNISNKIAATREKKLSKEQRH
jgi:hypothetical protein